MEPTSEAKPPHACTVHEQVEGFPRNVTSGGVVLAEHEIKEEEVCVQDDGFLP